MNYFYPHAMAQRVYQITPQLLKSWGVKGLILDIDNTLTTHDNPIPDAGVSAWLEQNRREGIAMIVLSNNKPERVEPFAKILGLDYISNGAKPLKRDINAVLRHLISRVSSFAWSVTSYLPIFWAETALDAKQFWSAQSKRRKCSFSASSVHWSDSCFISARKKQQTASFIWTRNRGGS